MAQYSSGTVDVTNLSATVTGTGTLWLAELSINDVFTIQGSGTSYQVSAITTDTSLTLTAPYGGVTASAQAYVVARDFTPTSGLPLLNQGDIDWYTFYNRSMTILD